MPDLNAAKKSRLYRHGVALGLIVVLCACAGERTTPPKHPLGPAYKVGNPYQVKGNWYYPKEDFSYDETGIASWYGQGFHGERTANGEIFNKDELTAAHPTLPMPSLARVTNLDNGRSIVVRINDRGPFAQTRLIDVSQRSAELLGFSRQGTAKVRVQVLADESKAIADAMRRYGQPAPAPVVVANNEEPPPSLAPAPRESVTSLALEPSSNTVETAPKPVMTTPQVHQELLQTEPVPQYVQLPLTTSTHIFVQAGAFKVLENAQRLSEKLKTLGPSSVTEATVNGTKFYRVRVGPIMDVSHADTMLQRVADKGVTKPRIIVD